MKDTRNNQNYRVRKMEDNKCWMIDNLKIANVTISSSDSAYVGADLTLPATKTSGSAGYDILQIWDPGNTTSCANGSGSTYSSASLTKCGYLYNFYTAIAATGTQTSFTSGKAPGSICPINWRLPTGYNNNADLNDFAVLNGFMAGDGAAAQGVFTDSKYYSNWLPMGVFQGAYAGLYWPSSLNNQGSFGRLWSSVAFDAGNASVSYFYIGSIVLSNGDHDRKAGIAVRCLASP
jgi:uncharacterized protein (TIGR02145 family)